MKPKTLLRFKELARRNEERAKDPRFLETMGFLVAKGFLGYNRPFPKKPNARLTLDAAIWAGKNVEPRILEILPAAVARLGRHFILPLHPTDEEKACLDAVAALRGNGKNDDAFLGIAIAKLKFWMDLPLTDGRTKVQAEKKRLKTFRLHPKVIEKLERAAKTGKTTETELLERLIATLL